jgi:cyclopropane fatty-acyl-phospholipid synthase-like methyltransferase
MVWNKTCDHEKRVWGDRPSEAALFAYNYLQQSRQFRNYKDIFILDLGCGYGRDAVFLTNNLPCHILGLDSSEKQINMARESLPKELEKQIELLCYDFSHVNDKYDVILVSNLYQLLKPEERAKLRDTVKRCLKANGILIFGTLSVRDPQHLGQGTPVPNETNSFIDQEGYVHLCTREELEKDFEFLHISGLFEREYHGPHSPEDHHHITWILIGKLK